jgi:hypothetical protein
MDWAVLRPWEYVLSYIRPSCCSGPAEGEGKAWRRFLPCSVSRGARVAKGVTLQFQCFPQLCTWTYLICFGQEMFRHGRSVGIETRSPARRPRIRNLISDRRKRFFSSPIGTCGDFFPEVKQPGSETEYLHLVPRVIIRGPIPSLSHAPS